MVFSSMVFLCIFLPVVFLLHLLLPGIRAKNGMLLLASLAFYAYGEPVYVIRFRICQLPFGSSDREKSDEERSSHGSQCDPEPGCTGAV